MCEGSRAKGTAGIERKTQIKEKIERGNRMGAKVQTETMGRITTAMEKTEVESQGELEVPIGPKGRTIPDQILITKKGVDQAHTMAGSSISLTKVKTRGGVRNHTRKGGSLLLGIGERRATGRFCFIMHTASS